MEEMVFGQASLFRAWVRLEENDFLFRGSSMIEDWVVYVRQVF